MARRRRFYGWLALYIGAEGLLYALVQPIPRFTYPIYGLFAFLAVQLVADVAPRLRAQPSRRP